MRTAQSYLTTLGPGLLYAGAAIGVSHLVQSTRAGALYGFQLAGLVILVNFLKYPFFAIGPKFAAVTGKDLVQAYQSLGRFPLILFTLMTIASMFITIAAISIVTAGISQSVFALPFSTVFAAFFIMSLAAIILNSGRYQALDRWTKYIVLALSVSTILAVILVWQTQSLQPVNSPQFSFTKHSDLFFLLAFLGWMPAPMEISVWHSLWTLEKRRHQPETQVSHTMLDFNIGYITTIILALAFICLGALLMHSQNQQFSPQAVPFAAEFMQLYTTSIGSWAYPIIAFCALATMLSTTLTCLDAYPRVLSRSLACLFPKLPEQRTYVVTMLGLIAGATAILWFYFDNMHSLVDFTTTVSFLAAPFIAALNLLVLKKFQKSYPELRSSKINQVFAIFSLFCLSGFSLYYLGVRIG